MPPDRPRIETPESGQADDAAREPAASIGGTGAIGRYRRWVPRLGPVVAAWAALPKVVSPPFHTASVNEVVDHLLPAAVVLAVSVWALVGTRRRGRSDLGMLAGGLVILLAGLWMGATHLPLVLQAVRHEAPLAATIHHTAASVAVLTYGALWTILFWNPSPPPQS